MCSAIFRVFAPTREEKKTIKRERGAGKEDVREVRHILEVGPCDIVCRSLVPSEMIIAAYFVGVNALSFTMLAEDKASSKGWIPFLGRIPGRSSTLGLRC